MSNESAALKGLVETNYYWAEPTDASGTGVLVLAGSSGRLDVSRAELFARHGVLAVAMRWFGGVGQATLPREIPLERFVRAIDRLHERCDRVVLLGLSYGAEAALCTASVDPRAAAVVAMQPTDVVWEGASAPGEAPTSKWTRNGLPLPFVPLSRDWQPPAVDPPAFVDLYDQSRSQADPATLTRAEIPVENISSELVLVAGGDDKVWDSARSAERIAQRRSRVGLRTSLVIEQSAGHPITLPGEAENDLERPYLVGGSAASARQLGRAAWPEICRVLRIEPCIRRR